MHAALLERSIDGLKAIRQHVQFSARLRAQVAMPEFGCKAEGQKCFNLPEMLGEAAEATNWRILDHCTAVTRAYALFEAFVSQILREYLVFLASSYRLSELGKPFVSKYTKGVGQILIDHQSIRYENFDIPSLMAEAAGAISDKLPYQIQAEAMLRKEQNLRMQELQRLFGHCGLSGLEHWLKKHVAVEEFFATSSRLSDTVESELKQIVNYRNEAAHGEVDQVLGAEVLTEFTEFFEALLRSIADFVQYDTLRRSKDLGRVELLGTVAERFRGGVVVARVSNTKITVGDSIYVFGKGATIATSVASIQIDGVGHDTIAVDAEREVGLNIGVRAKVGSELLRLN